MKIGVLNQWAAPTFIIPKINDNVRNISDFRELNNTIKLILFQSLNIQHLLLKLESSRYAISLDLTMGYYHIILCPVSRKLCTIVIPWGKFEYQILPMELCNSLDIF